MNSDSPRPSSSLFIELRVVYIPGRARRRPKNQFKDYFLLILQANPPQVVFFLDLGKKEPTVRLFFVIREDGVQNVDITFNDDIINSVYKYDTSN